MNTRINGLRLVFASVSTLLWSSLLRVIRIRSIRGTYVCEAKRSFRIVWFDIPCVNISTHSMASSAVFKSFIGSAVLIISEQLSSRYSLHTNRLDSLHPTPCRWWQELQEWIVDHSVAAAAAVVKWTDAIVAITTVTLVWNVCKKNDRSLQIDFTDFTVLLLPFSIPYNEYAAFTVFCCREAMDAVDNVFVWLFIYERSEKSTNFSECCVSFCAIEFKKIRWNTYAQEWYSMKMDSNLFRLFQIEFASASRSFCGEAKYLSTRSFLPWVCTHIIIMITIHTITMTEPAHGRTIMSADLC